MTNNIQAVKEIKEDINTVNECIRDNLAILGNHLTEESISTMEQTLYFMSDIEDWLTIKTEDLEINR